MSELISLGNSRRTQLLYPTDLWPNGVEVPIESGLFEIYPGEAIFNPTNGRVTSSGWSLVIAPIKNAHNWSFRSTKAEYEGILDENGNVIYMTASPSNVPVTAKYIFKSCRNATASSVLKGITFYYYPTHTENKGDLCTVPIYEDHSPYAGGGANNYSAFIKTNGAAKIQYSIGFRGCAHWYNGEKEQLFSRGYGEESGTYTAPEGAEYFKSQGYDGYIVDTSFIARYKLLDS